jgi:hypothetical protein
LVAPGEGYIHDKSLPVLGVANLAVEIGPLTGLFFSVVANNDGSFCAGNIGENPAGANQETIAGIHPQAMDRGISPKPDAVWE